jgi:hypothetical protein
VRAARVERNWTNFYHLVRDNIPSPSPRVWRDSWSDLDWLMMMGNHSQFDFMFDDPLFPTECRELQIDLLERIRNTSKFPYDP